MEFKKKNSLKFLKKQIQSTNFVFHLAGTNRSKNKKDFENNNVNLTSNICKFILDTKRKIPIFFSSTTKVNNKDSYYSKTKLQGENIIKYYEKPTLKRHYWKIMILAICIYKKFFFLFLIFII